MLRWSHKAKKVLQPVVHARHKTKIGEWIGQLPPFAGKLDWIDLNPDDDDYFQCGVRKLLKIAREHDAIPLDERSTMAAPAVRPSSGGALAGGGSSAVSASLA